MPLLTREVEVDVELDSRCTCGTDLTFTEEEDMWGAIVISNDPCPECSREPDEDVEALEAEIDALRKRIEELEQYAPTPPEHKELL